MSAPATPMVAQAGPSAIPGTACAWCGAPRDPEGETRIVDVQLGPFQDPDPEG